LKIEAGETVAIVGPTGGGKSTIAKLATRFYDPSSGTITIDGFDIRNTRLKSLRQQIGVVPQEPFLFAGSIRENIGFSKPEASDNEIIEALEISGLMPMVNSLPDGINTVIHERGASLSAGERQLIAIARALLSKPRVLVLDEATSNLDLQSESQVEHALDAILNGRSAIIVAHRLATVMRADRILVVDNGSIVESGSHEELINLKGTYSQMYSQWQRSVQSHDA
jgi:ATP-binding cassette subfamily B protein